MTDPAEPAGVGRLAERLGALVKDVSDYPTSGVLFKDITPLLADGPAFAAALDALVAYARSVGPIDVVAGVEARGFILGAPLALGLGVGFVPIRKHGKLPRAALSEVYALEYGEAELDIHVDAVVPGQQVLLVDDVLATGGTAAASIALLERAGAEVVAFAVLLELTFLAGRTRLAGHEVYAVLTP